MGVGVYYVLLWPTVISTGIRQTVGEVEPSLHGFAPMSDPCALPLCSAWFPDGFSSVPLQ